MPKTILILGGTKFLGRFIAQAALDRGHRLTLFNRGRTHPEGFPEVETLHGDRDGKLEALVGRSWDAVVDTSGYVPRIVKMSAELLAPRVQHYVFVSTISVYGDTKIPHADETLPVETISDPTNEDVSIHYGPLKALCEQAAEAALPGRVAHIRSGLIVGPGDQSGRFARWVSRMADGGEVLAPGDGASPVQLVDVRDIAAWIVRVIEDGTTGTYHALGPASQVTIREVLDTCNEVAGNRARLTWVPPELLAAHDVRGWSDLPLWIDPQGEASGFATFQNARAIAAGLTFRPLRDTAADTLAWLLSLPAGERARLSAAGLTRERELAVLGAWHSR